ncbi:MAG: ABC transporter substrate-binding protein [Clostridiales bacterium]|jgi:branched-chain amino acid transport system substrate-binding protein|nr:ABC transporter substrate-binding protein [Eubacteriales bacterium]MDH7565194.1 ABC transporter substrate-binding protein [Clostridiales bacterium]
MFKRLLALLVVVVMSVSLLAGCGGGGNTNTPTNTTGAAESTGATGDTITIGTIQPISGAISAYGTQSRDAIQMAVDEINQKGGVLGKKLKVVVEDDENTPEKTVNAFKKLVTQDKVIGIIGALTSKCSLAITKEAQQRKVIMISPSSTNDTVTDAGDYIFKACYNDSFQGPSVAKFAIETLKAKTAAVMFDNTNDYSVGLKDSFKKKFMELGGTKVVEESYATGDKDFNAQLTKLKASNPDVLFISDYYPTVSLMAKQIRNVGMDKVVLLGGDGWDEITNNAGDEVVGSYYSNHYAPYSDDKEVKDFVSKYQTKFNVVPNALAALAYDSTYILADAIQKAGSTDPEKIKAAMLETNKKFVTGSIKFDPNTRVPIKAITMVKIEKDSSGKLIAAFGGTINPQ